MRGNGLKICAMALLVLVAYACSEPGKEGGRAFVFAYFTKGGEDGLHLAYSYDALEWTTLNGGKPVLAPKVGKSPRMRDPCIALGPDGKFHMVWTTTTEPENLGFGYASSGDLVSWSEQRYLHPMANFKTARNIWAPELFYNSDDSLFYVVWASSVPELFGEVETNERGFNHRLFYTSTRDFEAFEPTELFFDPGFSVIDGAFFRFKGEIFMVLKNEVRVPREKNLRLTSGKKFTELSTEVSPNISGDIPAEGPTPFVLGDSVFIYFDQYTSKSYGAIVSSDCKTWTDISGKISVPKGAHHGTILEVESSVVAKLKETFK